MHTSRARTAGVLSFILFVSVVAVAVFVDDASAGGSVSLSPTSGPIGTVVSFSGEDCTATPDSGGTTNNIRVYMRYSGAPGNPAIGYGSVDATKSNRPFAGTFTIPDEWMIEGTAGFGPPEPGTYKVVFDCSGYVYGEIDIESSFTITATGSGSTSTTSSTTSPTTLPVTGQPPSVPTFQPPTSVPAAAVPMTGTLQESAPAGGSIGIDEGGFAPGEVVEVVIYSSPVRLGSITASSTGRAQGVLRLPSSVAAGEHTLVLFGGDTIKRSTIAVTAAPVARPTSPPATPTPVAVVPLTG